jgi:hypothetical protein
MSYPKWRHHPTKESMIVWDMGVEESQTPATEGWRDDRDFPHEPIEATPEPPKNKGGRPRKVSHD